MKSLLIPLPCFLALAFFFGGCEKAPPPPDNKAYFQVIEDNVQALNNRDVDAVMATVHPESPTFAVTRDLVNQMLSSLELKFSVSDLMLVTSTPEEAQVTFVQKTEKVGGTGQFQDNIVRGIHTLRLDHGKWKIYRTLQTKATALNAKPSAQPAPRAPQLAHSPTSTPEPAPQPAASGEKPAAPADRPAQ